MRTIPIALSTAPAPEEHMALCRAYGAVQERCSRVMAEQQADITRLEGEVVRLRAAVMARDAVLESAQEQLVEVARTGKTPRVPRAGWAERMRGWQWLTRSRSVAEPRFRRPHEAVDLTTAELLGRQGSWLSPGLDWPG